MKINVKGYEFEIDDKFLKEYEETMYERLEDNIECYVCTMFENPDFEEVLQKHSFIDVYSEIIVTARDEVRLYKGEI